MLCELQHDEFVESMDHGIGHRGTGFHVGWLLMVHLGLPDIGTEIVSVRIKEIDGQE